ncbi:MAG: ATP-binding protein [Planctomycetota bacterium]
MNRLAAATHIAIGLAFLTLGLLLGADMLGLVPDRTEALLQGRKQLCETVATSCSVAVERNDLSAIKAVLATTVERNDDVRSAGLRAHEGTLVADVGDHLNHWDASQAEASSPRQASIPIFLTGEQWGTVEITFVPTGNSTFAQWFGNGPWAMFLFVTGLGFVGYLFFLRRTLQHLDPSKTIPDRVRAMLDALAEGITVLDRQGRVVLANEQFADTIGIPSDNLMGRTLSSLSWRQDDAGENDALPWDTALAEGEIIRGHRLRILGKSGKTLTFTVNSAPVTKGSSRRGAVVTFDDVSPLEEKNAQLLEAMEELRKSRDRIQRQNRELDAAIRAATEASEAKSRFLASMSHEIRTPMTAILGYAEVLLEPQTTDEQRRSSAQTIQRNGQHLLALINDILDLSKIEAGKMSVDLTECVPADILREVGSLLTVKAREKGVELKVETDGPIPAAIQSDPTRLRQILVNLAGNSIKFTEKGSVTITAKMGDTSNPSHTMMDFVVSDTGIGMSPDQMSRIFGAFTQAETSTSRKFGGTGLGLTISRQLAQMLGGDIEASSQQGEGSTFTVHIDIGARRSLELVDAKLQPISSDQDSAKKASSIPTLTGRALLAEDGRDNQRLISHLLKKTGLTVDIAENGQIAVDKVHEQIEAGEPYDVIFMDLMMPEMDGHQAVALLREEGNTVPIVALTAHAMSGVREECIQAGFTDYASKPVNRSELYAAAVRSLECGTKAQPDRGGNEPPFETPAANPPSEDDGLHEVVDIAALMERLEGDGDVLVEVVESFLGSQGGLLGEIGEAMKSDQPALLERKARELKNALGMLRATAGFEAALNLEQIARRGEIEHADTAMARLNIEMNRLLPVIRSLLPAEIEATANDSPLLEMPGHTGQFAE